MKPFARRALVLSLLKRLRDRGSWSGETHIQKSAFVAQEAVGVPLGFEFILYKHGPFSFELRDELTAMQGEGLLDLVVKAYPYGPSLAPGRLADTLLGVFPRTVSKYARRLELVAEELAGFDVAELERIGTALYINRNYQADDIKARAKMLTRLKPHIEYPEALEAFQRADRLIDAAARFG